MIGAILGDMIGSPYEFDRGKKTKEFSLFSEQSEFTDDTVMTLAVARGFLRAGAIAEDETVRSCIAESLYELGHAYPGAGYGLRFLDWLYSKERKPYGSFGNGSAMRVSSAAWLFPDLASVRRAARLSAEVTHNHPEGIKGAEAVASVIFLARQGSRKEELRRYVAEEFGYDLSRSCDEIRPGYRHVETCQETVPEAITAFLEGDSFEDVIRTAVSLGGDCDTLTAIAGSMAEGYYGVPKELQEECRKRLPKELLEILEEIIEEVGRRTEVIFL